MPVFPAFVLKIGTFSTKISQKNAQQIQKPCKFTYKIDNCVKTRGFVEKKSIPGEFQGLSNMLVLGYKKL